MLLLENLRSEIDRIQRRLAELDAAGDPAAALPGDLLSAFDELLQMTDTADVEADARETVLQIDELAAAVDDCRRAHRRRPRDVSLDSVLRCWRSVLASLEAAAAVYEPPEPIGKLKKQRVSDDVICRIYGWVDGERGEPITRMVHEELENPGRHFNAATWVHPGQKKRLQKINEAWSKRTPRPKVQQEPERPKKAPPKDCRESIEELLLLPGITMKQIRRMKPSLTEDQINAAAAILGVDLGAEPGPSPHRRSWAERRAFEQEKERQMMAMLTTTLDNAFWRCVLMGAIA